MNASRYDVVKVIEAIDAGLDAVRIVVVRAGPRQYGTGLIHLLRETCFNSSRVELIDAELHISLQSTGRQLVEFHQSMLDRSENTTLVIVAYTEQYSLLSQHLLINRAVVMDVREEPLPSTRAEYLEYLEMNSGNGKIEVIETIPNHYS